MYSYKTAWNTESFHKYDVMRLVLFCRASTSSKATTTTNTTTCCKSWTNRSTGRPGFVGHDYSPSKQSDRIGGSAATEHQPAACFIWRPSKQGDRIGGSAATEHQPAACFIWPATRHLNCGPIYHICHNGHAIALSSIEDVTTSNATQKEGS